MRRITLGQILTFVFFFSIAVLLSISTTHLLLGAIPLGDFRGVSLLVAAIVFLYVYAIALYRLFLHFWPLCMGEIEPGSRCEFRYHLYLLSYLILFQPVTRSLLVPVPLMRLLYLALGARMGRNSYSGGVILDPPLTRIGENCIIGHDAVLFCHVVEGDRLAFASIDIGNKVTVGAKAVIMPGVQIGDGAIIAVGAVVLKGTRINSGELWAGVPARRVRGELAFGNTAR